MNKDYLTIKNNSHAELIEKKSKFIASTAHADTEEAACDFLNEVRKLHPMATHNCYAYIVGLSGQYQKASDDGEPSGTAGRPILEVIKREGVTNTIIVVTRYFGGILLGAGGLIRAYTEAAKLGIEASGIATMTVCDEVRIRLSYNLFGKVQREMENRRYPVKDVAYAEDVAISMMLRGSETESWIRWVTDAASGQARIEVTGQTYAPMDDDGTIVM